MEEFKVSIQKYQHYFSRLDKFLIIRSFEQNPEIMHKFIRSQNIKFKNRTQYVKFLIKHCIDDYDKNVEPEIARLMRCNRHIDIAKLENTLYDECIKVNPSLRVDKIWLPCEENVYAIESDKIEELFDSDFNFMDLEKILKTRIVGQDDAVFRVAQSIMCAMAGLRNPEQPIASFMFLGHTGIGKTQLAKTLAVKYFGDNKFLVSVNCSEYARDHETSKLIGAPPGYVGHNNSKNEGSWIYKETKNKESFVFLLDEIEKASSSFHRLLLQVLDEGFILDNYGRKILFNNAIIIMTSNVGSHELSGFANRAGFDKTHDMTSVESICFNALKKKFDPEFINRIDEIVVFKDLSPESLVKIFDILMDEYALLVMEKDINLTWTDEVAELIIRKASCDEYGARDLKRLIKREIINILSELILNKDVRAGDEIVFYVVNNEIAWEVVGQEDSSFVD